MLVHAFVGTTLANGPGRRTALWLQGCEGMNCPGCWNPATHPYEGEDLCSAEVAEHLWALSEAEGTTGFTISGGEPLQQTPELLLMLDFLHERAAGRMSFGLFTGYTWRELETGAYRLPFGELCFNAEQRTGLWRKLAARGDWLKCRGFNRQQPETEGRPLVTSRNQDLHLLTNRHTVADFPPPLVELRFGRDGTRMGTGFPLRGSLL